MAFEIKGGKELAALLRQLPDKVAKDYMVKALKAGAQVVVEEARTSSPHKTGDLEQGLHITTTTKGGVATAKVSNDPKQYYAVMQDRGWIPQARYKNGKKVAFRAAPHVPGKYFMEGALSKSAEAATQVITDTLRTSIETNTKK